GSGRLPFDAAARTVGPLSEAEAARLDAGVDYGHRDAPLCRWYSVPVVRHQSRRAAGRAETGIPRTERPRCPPARPGSAPARRGARTSSAAPLAPGRAGEHNEVLLRECRRDSAGYESDAGAD